MRYIYIIILIFTLIIIQRYCYYGLQVFEHNSILNNTDSETIQQKIEVMQRLKDLNDNLLNKLGNSEHQNDPRVVKLFNNWSGRIEELELNIDENILAYNTNKGEKINICMMDPITNNVIEDTNTMFFVLLHELAHVMTQDYEHNAEFWENFSFLIEFAKSQGLYKYQNYNKAPIMFCGNKINHTPYTEN